MMLAKWEMATIVVLTIGITAAGAGGLALQEADEPQTAVTTKGREEPSKIVPPGGQSPLEKQISKLKANSVELSSRIKAKENEWIQLAQKSIIDLTGPPATPNRASLDEYGRVWDQLVQTSRQ